MAKHGAYRGTTIVPADARGNVYNRRARKAWLLSQGSGFGGDGDSVRCYWCPALLTAESMEVDRYPLCGHAGGGYRRANIVPACKECNAGRCTRTAAPCRVEVGRTLELFDWRPNRVSVSARRSTYKGLTAPATTEVAHAD